MAAIERFFEAEPDGKRTGRQLLKHTKEPMPDAAERCTWCKDDHFSVADELLASPALKADISEVIEKGFKIVAPV